MAVSDPFSALKTWLLCTGLSRLCGCVWLCKPASAFAIAYQAPFCIGTWLSASSYRPPLSSLATWTWIITGSRHKKELRVKRLGSGKKASSATTISNCYTFFNAIDAV